MFKALLREDRADREAIGRVASLRERPDEALDVIVDNLSATGCLIRSDVPLRVRSAVTIGMSGVGIVPALVAWRDGNAYGCTFVRPITVAEIEQAKTVQTTVNVDFGKDGSGLDPQTPTDRPEWRLQLVEEPFASNRTVLRALGFMGGYTLRCLAAFPIIVVAAAAAARSTRKARTLPPA